MRCIQHSILSVVEFSDSPFEDIMRKACLLREVKAERERRRPRLGSEMYRFLK